MTRAGTDGRPGPGPHLDARLKTRLQSLGVAMAEEADARAGAGGSTGGRRSGGAGPAEGMTLLFEGRAVTVPSAPLGSDTPFSWTESAGRGALVGEEGTWAASVPRLEDFYSRSTRDGVEYRQVALLHGSDCLASTVIQSCAYWGGPDACGFCGIGTSLREGRTVARKTPAQLAEVARAALDLGVKSVTLTSGSTHSGRTEVRHLAACTEAVVEASGLPVQVQALNPSPDDLRLLREAGASSIGLHVESLDFDVLARVAPVKARLGWEGFVSLWNEAVEVFGRWQVVTYIIAGLGEDLQTTLGRLPEVVRLGVYPHVVPFRPVPGAPLAHLAPPAPALMERLYRETAHLLRAAGGSWHEIAAGCGRCTACSALPDFEDELSAEVSACGR